MPYVDSKKRQEHLRLWRKARRDAWIAENGPCKHCGSAEDLQVDHIDPKQKLYEIYYVWRLGDDLRLAGTGKVSGPML